MSRRKTAPRPDEGGRSGEAARARAEIERPAGAQGVTPFSSLEEFAAPSELAADSDVNEFAV